MSIQDELFKKYGTEEQVIKSITTAINGEVDALDTLSQKSYYEWLASVDSLTGAQKFGNGFFKIFTGISDQYKSALDSAVDYMEDKTQFFYVKTTGNKELDSLIQEKFGLHKNAFDEFVIKDMVPEEAYELLGEIRTAYRENASNYLGTETDNILTTVNDSIQSAMTTIDAELGKHQETYHTYLEGMIKYDSEYSDEYADLLSKRALLEEAELSTYDDSKQQRILEAKKAFYESLNNAITSAENNDNVKRYFENLYPDLYSEISSWNFEYSISANTDGIADTAKEIGEKYTATDLLDMIDDESSTIADSAFNSLIDKTVEYGICTDKSAEEVQKLIDLLVELGIVQDDVKGETSNNEPPISLSISETVDQLNTKVKPAFDSLKSAYQNIFTDDGFKLNSIDILSTCDSIKSKLDELNKTDDITVDYSSYEEFVKVLSNSESTEKKVKDAFDDLATSITNTGLSGAEDFATLKAALEDLGVVNSEIVAFDAFISNTEALKEANLDLANATYEDIAQFADEHITAENLAQAINMLTQQKMLNAMENMDASTEVANMISLAKKAGVTGEVIANLTELEKIYQEVAQGTLSEHMLSKKLDRANELKQLIEDGITKVDYTPEVDFSGASKSAEKSASSAAKSFTDLLDKELNVLDKKMEAGYIDFNDYIKARLDLIEDYYRQGKLSADEYYSYLEKHYKQELSYRDKVINAVTRRIDKEIDSLEKQKEKIKDYYQTQIDAYEKEKTLLEEKNRERQKEIDLQKAMYELERAKNQRTKLIYSEDKGMHYVADDASIRDAGQEVENAEYELKILEIENEITKLEQARDRETNAIDAMIDKLEAYKDQWNDITSAYEESQEDLMAEQMLGRDWEKDILDTRLDKLNQFKDDYIKIQQAMVDAAYQAAQAIEKQEKIQIGDSSGGGNNSGDPENGYEVIDEKTTKRIGDVFTSKQEAQDFADNLNKNKAASNGIDVSGDKSKWMKEFGNSDIPGYYVKKYAKKYHTGLKQGPVDSHSFDEDFRLVQRTGLGAGDVPAILQQGEAVATPDQIHNLADGLRQSALPDGILPLSPDHPLLQISRQFVETIQGNRNLLPNAPAYTGYHGGIESMTRNAGHVTSAPQQVVNQHIVLNCPNVTNQSGVEYIQRELGHLSLRALQESRKH